MLWLLKKNKDVTETVKKMSSVNDEGVITDHQVGNWFSKFCSGDTLLRDDLRLERSSDVEQDALTDIVEYNQRKSTRELALNLNPQTAAT